MQTISIPRHLEARIADVIRKELAWHDAQTPENREWMFGGPTTPISDERSVVLVGVTEQMAAALNDATFALAESTR